MSNLLIGQTLEERYRFETLVGQGTFASVYRITDLKRRTTLAAKVLHPEIAHEPALVERFRREASILARLQHPNIVRYYGIVEAQGHIFILMDFIEGPTFETILSSSPEAFTPQKLLSYLTPLAAALHYAHSEGVIHRDLKPANILIEERNLFVTDFGIARILTQTSTLTQGMTLGTPYYLSPEQINGQPVTPAADIYALGILLYRASTGVLPFRGVTPGAAGDTVSARIVHEHLHTTPQSPADLNPHLGPAVADVILRCLQKDPARRFHTIAQMVDAFAEAAGGTPIALSASGFAPQEIEPPPDMKLPEWSQFIDQVPAPEPAQAKTPLPPEDSDQATAPPPTEPHLEESLKKQTAAPTHPSLGQMITEQSPPVPPHPAPTPARTPRLYPPAPRRELPVGMLAAAVVGVLLVVGVLCAGVLYVLDPWGQSDQSSKQGVASPSPATAASSITQAAPPVFDGGNRIAFDSRQEGTLDIYVMNSDASNLRRLTDQFPGAERGPAWSPDGTQIAFYGAPDEQSNYDIYLVNHDGTGLQNITNTPDIDERYPAWSPDGTQLAFHSNADGDYDLYSVRRDGSGRRAITNNDVQDLGPDWSPDGVHLVFHTDLWGYPYEIAVLDLTTSRITRLTDSDDINTFATWSPDGTQIAYNTISRENQAVNLVIIQANGSNPRWLTASSERNAFPDWSPNGQHIIYQYGLEGASAIYTISAAGGTPQALTGATANFLPEWEPYR